MWLTSYPPGSDLSSSRGTAREVTGSGAVLGRAIRLPAGYQIARGTAAGLLLTAETGPTATYELWNPARGRPMRKLRHVVALSAAQIASAQPGGIRVLNLRTAGMRRIRIPASGSVIDGTFSPDGRYLALLIGFGIRIGVGGALAIRLEVTAAIGGHVVVIPPASAWSGDLAGYGWAAGSDILVTELGIGNFMGVTSWQPGTGRVGEATLVPDAVTAGLVSG
jgi:hypothetical protein